MHTGRRRRRHLTIIQYSFVRALAALPILMYVCVMHFDGNFPIYLHTHAHTHTLVPLTKPDGYSKRFYA